MSARIVSLLLGAMEFFLFWKLGSAAGVLGEVQRAFDLSDRSPLALSAGTLPYRVLGGIAAFCVFAAGAFSLRRLHRFWLAVAVSLLLLSSIAAVFMSFRPHIGFSREVAEPSQIR